MEHTIHVGTALVSVLTSLLLGMWLPKPLGDEICAAAAASVFFESLLCPMDPYGRVSDRWVSGLFHFVLKFKVRILCRMARCCIEMHAVSGCSWRWKYEWSCQPASAINIHQPSPMRLLSFCNDIEIHRKGCMKIVMEVWDWATAWNRPLRLPLDPPGIRQRGPDRHLWWPGGNEGLGERSLAQCWSCVICVLAPQRDTN